MCFYNYNLIKITYSRKNLKFIKKIKNINACICKYLAKNKNTKYIYNIKALIFTRKTNIIMKKILSYF